MRSLLQAHLKEALRAERGQIRFGRRCEGVTLTPDGAHVRFVGGAEVHADIVIGCDGLRSQVRESLALSQPLQEYRKAYLRGVAEIELEADTLRETWCPDGRLFGTAPLPEGRTYFYCSAPLGAWFEVRRDRESLDAWIQGWGRIDARLERVLRAVADWDAVNYDEARSVRARRWFRGRVFLAGDSAHAMLPYLGQGANCAMVDAVVLVRMLSCAGTTRPLWADDTRLCAVRSRSAFRGPLLYRGGSSPPVLTPRDHR